jgi:glycosyltransferase involved in cell wall biosynthesis
MRVLVAIDHHFVRGAEGAVYLGPPMAIGGYRFWKQYLKVFEEVTVLARMRRSPLETPATALADGEGVRFHDLPDYLGPWQYLRWLPYLRRRVRQAIAGADTFILRVPGTIGQLVWREIRSRGRPYALDVVADPWDMFSPGAVPSIVRPVVRRLWSTKLRDMCHEAPVVSYVTQGALQKRYPPGPGSWTTQVSDVDLTSGLVEADKLRVRTARLMSRLSAGGTARVRIGFLGALAQMYKAPDVLLRGVAACVRDGLDLEVALAGDGKFRGAMEKLASDLGLGDRVHFQGALPPGEPVWRFLDQVDLFVLPSRQEGLPRAMVEAMARGCPCLGSEIGGIPELLPPEDLVPPGDVEALAAKIREVLAEPERLARMARRDWETAQQFQPDVLEERRLAFYRKVREQAERPSDPAKRIASVVGSLR